MPELVTAAQTYDELRDNLAAYAKAREEEEKGRTHYRCVLSFERDVESKEARALVREWLRATFPKALAVSFLHHNTRHLHAHVWLDARQTDGKKIDLSPRAYRQIDETWNRLYSRALGRDEREHLDKKEETQRYREQKARGVETQRPVRGSREEYEARDENRPGRDVRGTSRGEQAAYTLAHTGQRALHEVAGLREALARLGKRLRDVAERDEEERER